MRRGAAGFTLIELLVAIVILSILLAIGIPGMSNWMRTSKAMTAAEFYAEGMKMARAEAVKRNVASRLTLIPVTDGQFDWQVDICMPTPTTLCRDNVGDWSTPTTVAGGAGLEDFRSIRRSSAGLLKPAAMEVAVAPVGADQVYFTPIGWVDTGIAGNITKIQVAPANGMAGAFPTSAVVLTLAGVVFKCDPTISSTADSRACP